ADVLPRAHDDGAWAGVGTHGHVGTVPHQPQPDVCRPEHRLRRGGRHPEATLAVGLPPTRRGVPQLGRDPGRGEKAQGSVRRRVRAVSAARPALDLDDCGRMRGRWTDLSRSAKGAMAQSAEARYSAGVPDLHAHLAPIESPDLWRQLNPHLTITDTPFTDPPIAYEFSSRDIQRGPRQMCEDGYLQS